MPTLPAGFEPKPPTSRSRFILSKNFENWIKRTLGATRSPFHNVENDDDWTFVVKMHAIVEAGLNHLLITRLNNPKLSDVIAKLETNDRRKGKMAFVRAYDLLPEDCCLFVQVLSEIRNTAVHNAKSFDLDLTKYVAELKTKEQRNKWKRALASWWTPSPVPDAQHEATGKRILESALDDPRHGIFSSCISILAMARVQEANLRQNLQNELDGLVRFRYASEQQKATPTE